MDFRIDLSSPGEGTLITVKTDLALPGPTCIHQLLRPAYEWGLKWVCRKGLQKEGIKTNQGSRHDGSNHQHP